DGIEDLKNFLSQRLPQSPFLYDQDALTDTPERVLAAELTREQLFLRLRQEVPYGLTVEPEKWEERKDKSVAIHQAIIVSREKHKGIVLGKGGAMLKEIGAAARQEIESLLGGRAHLFLFVKVREDWKHLPEALRDISS